MEKYLDENEPNKTCNTHNMKQLLSITLQKIVFKQSRLGHFRLNTFPHKLPGTRCMCQVTW